MEAPSAIIHSGPDVSSCWLQLIKWERKLNSRGGSPMTWKWWAVFTRFFSQIRSRAEGCSGYLSWQPHGVETGAAISGFPMLSGYEGGENRKKLIRWKGWRGCPEEIKETWQDEGEKTSRLSLFFLLELIWLDLYFLQLPSAEKVLDKYLLNE